jgi:hypothetical protein
MLDVAGLAFDDAGISTLPSGTVTVSNTAHSWAWRGFAASN